MPLGGQPADMLTRIEACDAWLAASTGIPKLLLMIFEGSPTLVIIRETADWFAANIAALASAYCGQAGHHAPPRTAPKRSPPRSPPGQTGTTC